MAKAEKTFTVWLETPSFELTVGDIWPDGDAPDNPTEKDVKTAMEDYGGVSTVVKDWNLDMDIKICISGQGGMEEYE